MPSIDEVSLVGKRQDLSDALLLANAADLPFTTMVKKGSAPNNTLLEYPIDKYREARVESVPDGKDVEAFENTQENRRLIQSRMMKQWCNPQVSDFAENVTDQAGDEGSKMAQAKAKATRELKQDMERTALGTQDSSPQSSPTVGAFTRGLGTWIQTAAHSDLPVPDGFRPVTGQINSGSLSAFEEDELRALLQARYETVRSSGDLVLLCGTGIKNKISDFARFDENGGTKYSIRRFDNTTATVDTSVSIYKGDYGSVKVFLDMFLPTQNTGYLLDMANLEIRATRYPGFTEVENRGGGPRGIIDCIWGLVNRHPQSHCKAVLS